MRYIPILIIVAIFIYICYGWLMRSASSIALPLAIFALALLAANQLKRRNSER